MRCFLCTLYSGCAPPYPAGAGRRRVVGLPSWTLSHYSTTNKTTTYCTDIFPDSGDTSLSPKKPHSTANRCKLTVGSGMWFFLGRVPSSRTSRRNRARPHQCIGQGFELSHCRPSPCHPPRVELDPTSRAQTGHSLPFILPACRGTAPCQLSLTAGATGADGVHCTW